MRKVRIFDTTLRDGEQSPGASMNAREKLEVARQLARLNVDALEAGFPISSRGDFDSVRQVAREVRGPVIAALARANKGDIECAGDALRPARRKRIHTFIATSDIHMEKKLKKSPHEVLQLAVAAVKLARKFTDDVEFSPEDATRTRPDFLAKVVREVIKAGAGTINVPDTVGYGTPSEFGRMIRGLYARVPALRRATVSVHCHNDLGLAVASSLAGVEAGAGQVECTINGIGERAGNASLEEVVMALKTRRDYYGCETQVVTEELWRASRLVSRLTGVPVQPNKAIVGANAFAHEAGIHQHGMIMSRATYEIMTPESVGVPESRLVLGKHSGRHMVRRKLDELGLGVAEGEVDRIYTSLMALADRKKYVYDEDVIALVEGSTGASADVWVLEDLAISTGRGRVPTATVRLRKGKRVAKSSGRGDGPVDATYRAIDRLTHAKPELVDYSLRAITSGKDAQGEVTVRLRSGSREVSGRGASTDIIEASAKAYLNGVNRLQHGPAKGAARSLGRV